MPASITITITGPDQPSLAAMVAAFAEAKGWRPESGYEAVEFSRTHLGAYFNEAVAQAALAKLAAKHAEESKSVADAIAAQSTAFTLTVE